MSTERIRIDRSDSFHARASEERTRSVDGQVIGSVVEYSSQRDNTSISTGRDIDPSFEIKCDLEKVEDIFDGPIPDDALDLVELATAIFGVDKFVSRKIVAGEDISDTEARLNTRSIAVEFPVLSSSLATEAAEELISTAISHMTRDLIEFEFVDQPRSGKKRVNRQTRLVNNTDNISLFSDGLDSAGGVYQNEREGLNAQYVSLRYGSGLGSTYNYISDVLDIDPVVFRVEYDDDPKEWTTFSRGFLHWAFATVAANAVGAPEVRAFETGLMAEFVLLSEGWHTTRTVSPVAVDLYNEFLTEVMEWETQVVNPFINQTKKEVVNRIADERVVRKAVSCPHHVKQMSFDLDNCGQCVPCIIRNIAILESEFEIETEQLSVCDWGDVDFESQEFPEDHAAILPDRNDEDTFFLAMGEIAYLCRLLQNEDPDTVASEFPRLASPTTYELHKKFAEEFIHCFESIEHQNPTVNVLLQN